MGIYLGTTPLANTGYDKANTDLSNLTSTGKNIANWSSNVSNCITEIPQDIKLELNNGTLTLKAGSKVYKTDGEVVTILSDITYYFNVATLSDLILVYDSSVSGMGVYVQGYNSVSASTAPSGVNDILWFDTTSNKCKITHDNASTWTEIPLPIGVVDCTTTDGFTSIDQVFNGFGYIGSTVFALPGVKGLIPNGRNADDSLKNIEWNLTQVLIKTESWSNEINSILLRNNGIVLAQNLGSYEKAPAAIGYHGNYYNPKDNIVYVNTSSSTWAIENCMNLGKATSSNGVITSLTPKTAFHAVDYNDAVFKSDLATCHVVVETYVNGTSWYRVYSDGWCEQGGFYDCEGVAYNLKTINLLKPYKDTNYSVFIELYNEDYTSAAGIYYMCVHNKTTESFNTYFDGNVQRKMWFACGYIR